MFHFFLTSTHSYTSYFCEKQFFLTARKTTLLSLFFPFLSSMSSSKTAAASQWSWSEMLSGSCINYATALLQRLCFSRKPFSDLSLTIYFCFCSKEIDELRNIIGFKMFLLSTLMLHKKINNQQHLALIDNKPKRNTFSLVIFTTVLSFSFVSNDSRHLTPPHRSLAGLILFNLSA